MLASKIPRVLSGLQMPADRNGAFCADPGTPSRGRGQGAGAESSPLGPEVPGASSGTGHGVPATSRPVAQVRPESPRVLEPRGRATRGEGGRGTLEARTGTYLRPAAPRGEETRCCPKQGPIKGKLRGHLGKRQTRPSKAWRPAHSLAGGTPSHRRPPRCGLFQRQTLAEEGAFTKTGRLSLEKAVVRVYLFLFFKERFKNIQLN